MNGIFRKFLLHASSSKQLADVGIPKRKIPGSLSPGKLHNATRFLPVASVNILKAEH